MSEGEPVAEAGTLVRDGAGFALRRDGGGLLALDLHRVPVDHVEKHVVVTGRRAADGRLEVDAVRAG